MAIVFLLILLPIIGIGDMKFKAHQQAASLQKRYDVILEKAVHDGAAAMLNDYLKRGEGLDETLKVNPMQGIDQFLETLSLNMNRESKSQKEELLLYIPCIIVIDYDGFYTYGAVSATNSSGQQVTTHVLKPKTLFSYRINNQILTFHINGDVVIYDSVKQEQLLYTFEEAQHLPELAAFPLSEIKAKVIADTLERALNQQVNTHNTLAHQNGIAYTFYIPQIDESELQNAFSDVGIIAFFQGMPLGGSERLNLYALGGSRIFKRSYYEGFVRNGVRVVCRSNCIENNGIEPLVVFHTTREAAKEGYFPCQTCKP